VQWHGDFGVCDVEMVAALLNQTPMKPIGYSDGLAEMQRLIARFV
jgi:hypothetical protein